MDSQHYGDGLVTFPDEQRLLHLLNEERSEFDFTDAQIELIFSWLEDTVHKKFGEAKYLFPDEKEAYGKILELYNRIERDEKAKKESDERLKKINEKANQVKTEHDALKNRSFEEKMRATNKLKEDMAEIEKQYRKISKG